MAKLANVNIKTIKRVLTRDNYVPRIDLAERLSSALDCVTLAAETVVASSRPAAMKAKAKAEA